MSKSKSDKYRNAFVRAAYESHGGPMKHRNDKRKKERADIRVHVAEWDYPTDDRELEYFDCELA